MNFVCAAGTGSSSRSSRAPSATTCARSARSRSASHTSHLGPLHGLQEQDIQRLLREGRSREEALAGGSIHRQELPDRGVGSRPVTGERIFFQGATARNTGLVAAFELITGKEIVVSPHCHVMGALGAAVISLEHSDEHAGVFRGLDVFERDVDVSYRTCTDCANRCTITVVRIEGGAEESWGYMCGRDGHEGADGYPRPHEDPRLRDRENTRPVNHLSRVRAMMNGARLKARIRIHVFKTRASASRRRSPCTATCRCGRPSSNASASMSRSQAFRRRTIRSRYPYREIGLLLSRQDGARARA